MHHVHFDAGPLYKTVSAGHMLKPLFQLIFCFEYSQTSQITTNQVTQNEYGAFRDPGQKDVFHLTFY